MVVVVVSLLPPYHGVVVVVAWWLLLVMINKIFKRKITRAQTMFRSFVPMWGYWSLSSWCCGWCWRRLRMKQRREKETVDRGNTPLPSRISSEGGVVVGGRETLCLAFRVREWWCVDGENTPPPSCVSSEGRGSSGVLTEETPPLSCISSKGGVVVGGRKTLRLVF
jgi:hypothetical protein